MGEGHQEKGTERKSIFAQIILITYLEYLSRPVGYTFVLISILQTLPD